MDRVLILGIGNADREDDGVAWHVLNGIANRLGRKPSDELGEGFFPEGDPPHLWFQLQLTPEAAETIAAYDRVCFIDAHTGAVENDLNVQSIQAAFQASPFTHHLTPQSCLSLANSLYGASPEAVLVSIRGYQFGFSTALSDKTHQLAQNAVGKIMDWLQKTQG